MNLKVALKKAPGGGVHTLLSYGGRSIKIFESKSLTHRASCRRAAEKLRAAADRFELLAEEVHATWTVTHTRINARTIK